MGPTMLSKATTVALQNPHRLEHQFIDRQLEFYTQEYLRIP